MSDLPCREHNSEAHPCFLGCDCKCITVQTDFDRVLREETLFRWDLNTLCHSNIGWYADRSTGPDHLINLWNLRGKSGLYLLWHKDDYCGEHDLFHMRALYVGKGAVAQRIITHWAAKDFSAEMLVYWTFVEMPNRMAKYYEQLLLDLFDIPANRAENPGTARLCAYMTQDEVD